MNVEYEMVDLNSDFLALVVSICYHLFEIECLKNKEGFSANDPSFFMAHLYNSTLKYEPTYSPFS